MFMKRTDNNLLTKWWLGVDKVVLFAVLGFTVFGALMVVQPDRMPHKGQDWMSFFI